MINRIPGFNLRYEYNQKIIDVDYNPSKRNLVHRPWQEECYNSFSKKRENSLLNAMMGAGKSVACCAIVHQHLIEDPNLLIIISVPMKNIGAGFAESKEIILPNNTIINWQIDKENNLCANNSSDISKTKKLIHKIKTRFSNVLDRVVICSHTTLSRTFDYLKEKNDLDCLNNIALWIDEAHHVSSDGEDHNNKMGQVAQYFDENQDKSLTLHLMTATFFRGDRGFIVSNKFLQTCKSYKLPYDRHFEENCQYIKQFSYDFLLYEKDWIEPIKDIFNQKLEKTIIFMPPVNSRYANDDKYTSVNNVLDAIAGESGVVAKKSCYDIIYRDGNSIIVVDLVDESNQEKGLEYILKYPDKVDVVISLNVAGEGFNWEPAKREIIIGIRKSLTQLMQMIGRIFRDHVSKKDEAVKILQLIPYVDKDLLDKEETKSELNNSMKVIYSLLILQSVFDPEISIPTKSKKESKSIIKKTREYIASDVGDIVFNELVQEITNSLTQFVDQNNECLTDEKSLEIALEVISNYEIKEYNEEIAHIIINSMNKATNVQINLLKDIKQVVNGIDVSQIDLKLIEEIERCGCAGFILGFTNGTCGIKTLRDYRQYIKQDWMPFEEAREFVHELSLKSWEEWFEYCKSRNKPDNIPNAPNWVYKEYWKGISNWLGTGKFRSQFDVFPFKKARKYVHGLKLDTKTEWFEYCKSGNKPDNIPNGPYETYKEYWISWGDWFGNGKFSSLNVLPFEEAREYVHGLKLESQTEWNQYCKSGNKPDNIPAGPNRTYKNKGWISWGDWFGTNRIADQLKEYLPFEKAKEYVRKLKLENITEWYQYCKSGNKPDNIPTSPGTVYKDEWKGVGDWLGTRTSNIIK